jgi:hypothetical protein
MPEFDRVVIGARPVRGRDVPILSNDRMNPQNMNPEPSEVRFRENANGVILIIVARTVHRYVNDLTFKTIDLVGTPQDDANIVGVGRNRLTKQEMAESFIHNSQRAYWREDVILWAQNVVLPIAARAVLFRIQNFI